MPEPEEPGVVGVGEGEAVGATAKELGQDGGRVRFGVVDKLRTCRILETDQHAVDDWIERYG